MHPRLFALRTVTGCLFTIALAAWPALPASTPSLETPPRSRTQEVPQTPAEPDAPAADSPCSWTAPLRYEIWVELDDKEKKLHAKEEISWTNTSRDTVPDMLFHLYWNAFKNELSTVLQENGEETMFRRGNRVKDGEWGWIDVPAIELADGRDLKPSAEFVVRDEPFHPGDQTVMRVVFPEPVKPGETVRIKLAFESKIPRTVMRSGYYRDSFFFGQWFPKPGVYEEGKGWNCHEYHAQSEFFADFADFKVHITVPDKFVVGASGKQVGAAADAGKKAVTCTFEQSRIHDFAWTASPDFIKVERDFVAADEVTPLEYSETASKLGLPVDEVSLPDVKMILLIQRQHKNQIDRHFKALRTALKYYGLWYGPYPYETVTMVDPPYRTGSGGMEYPTLFTAGTRLFTSRDVLSPEGVIIHEFGHGYWYGLVANNEFEEAWLDEGLTTYSTGRVLAKAYGPGAQAFIFNGVPLNLFLPFPKAFDSETGRAAAIHAVEFDPIVTKSWLFYGGGSYSLNVYVRASTCLISLEKFLGEETMSRILRTFHMRWRFRHPATEDFLAVVNEVSGKDMRWFFDEFFFNTLDFDYGIASLRSEEKPRYPRGVFDVDGKKEEMTGKKIRALEKEAEKSGKPADRGLTGKASEGDGGKSYITTLALRRYGEARIGGDARLKVKVVFEDGSEEIRCWDGRARWSRMTFVKPSKARLAQIDPETVWLIDSNLANNSYLIKPVKRPLFKFAAKFLFLVQNVLQLAAGVS